MQDNEHKYATVFEENIPAELKRIEQWVCWSGVWSDDGEKLNKPPMRASGRNGSSTDERCWTTFEKSLGALGGGGIYVDGAGTKHNVTLDGIGLAGLERTPYTGIDLDHCINPETGEINPAALGIVQYFDSYTEITPSGDGLRIWIEAKKSMTWSANKGGGTEIEIYDKGRFFTVTGRHLPGTPRTIEPRQNVLDAFMKLHAPRRRVVRPKPVFKGGDGRRLDLDTFLGEHNMTILRDIRDGSSQTAYAVVCPWVDEHTGGDDSGTRVGQYDNGALWFRCEHGHCRDLRKWSDFRKHFQPECYTPWWVKEVAKND